MLQNNISQDIRAKIFYFNDLHSNIKGAKRIKTASDTFDLQHSKLQNQMDIMKFSAGDTYIGKALNNFAGVFLNSLGLTAYVPGNHEFDMGTERYSKYIDGNKFKTLISNIIYKQGANMNDDVASQRICKSTIIEKNGHKYGLIGATDTDIKDNMSAQSIRICQDISIMDTNNTIKAIQQEVDALKRQGINKIILISHLGLDKDKLVAKSTEGIDVIVGGHSHTVLNSIKPNENYFMSKANEPVLIVQAGMNGDYYGTLDLIFDKDGKIKAADNIVTPTKNINESTIINTMENKIFGEPQKLGTIKGYAPKPSNFDISEQPMAEFVADAIREKAGADIAFHNKFCQKIDVKSGEMNDRELLVVLPYINEVTKYRYSEKDVVDVVKAGLLDDENGIKTKVGNVQVSGLNYVVTKDRQLKELYFIDKNNKKIKIDINNPRKDKFYTVVYGSFFAGGPGKLALMKAPDKLIEMLPWDDFTAVKEKMLRYGNKPIELKEQGRIRIV